MRQGGPRLTEYRAECPEASWAHSESERKSNARSPDDDVLDQGRVERAASVVNRNASPEDRAEEPHRE